MEAAQQGARHGVWIADEQTSGRGRGSHSWYSAPGDGVYLSALISPQIPAQSAQKLSFRVAMAVQSAIASITGFKIRDQIDIRWPNDLLLNGRKVGGILIEAAVHPAHSTGPAMLRYGVIGIGINCNHTDFPPTISALATSIRRETGSLQPIRREPLIAAILIALDEEIRLLVQGWRGTNNRRDRDLTNFSSWIKGKRVHVEDVSSNTSGYRGTTAGLTSEGFLLVQGDDGILHTVVSGGVRALP